LPFCVKWGASAMAEIKFCRPCWDELWRSHSEIRSSPPVEVLSNVKVLNTRMPFCTKCGSSVPPETKFCSQCGGALQVSPLESQSSPPVEAPSTKKPHKWPTKLTPAFTLVAAGAVVLILIGAVRAITGGEKTPAASELDGVAAREQYGKDLGAALLRVYPDLSIEIHTVDLLANKADENSKPGLADISPNPQAVRKGLLTVVTNGHTFNPRGIGAVLRNPDLNSKPYALGFRMLVLMDTDDLCEIQLKAEGAHAYSCSQRSHGYHTAVWPKDQIIHDTSQTQASIGNDSASTWTLVPTPQDGSGNDRTDSVSAFPPQPIFPTGDPDGMTEEERFTFQRDVKAFTTACDLWYAGTAAKASSNLTGEEVRNLKVCREHGRTSMVHGDVHR
jgi:zinc-ribbon domain